MFLWRQEKKISNPQRLRYAMMYHSQVQQCNGQAKLLFFFFTEILTWPLIIFVFCEVRFSCAVLNFSKLRVQCSPSVSVKLVCSPVTKMWVLACIFADNIANVIDLCENNLLCLIVSGTLTDFRIFLTSRTLLSYPWVFFGSFPEPSLLRYFCKIKHPSDTITQHSIDRKEYLKLINVARAAI